MLLKRNPPEVQAQLFAQYFVPRLSTPLIGNFCATVLNVKRNHF